ncbi:phosphoenolpyruvate carboxylase [Aeromicrobium sp. UC242_57]|uniref:phosphoenolpyruvate carboxylase n=1 Tax=Aeromicrobium sp. UC242_57 TaxID=3374624 RepID=UPI0037BB327F
MLDRLEYRPVFTAHPTEASRRTVLRLLRKVAETIHEMEDPRRPASQVPADERRLPPRLVDLIWQTDELRVVQPSPRTRPARRSTALRSIASEVVPSCWPSSTGSWVVSRRRPAGDGPAVAIRHLGGRRPRRKSQRHPQVTLDILHLQHMSAWPS